MKSKTMSARLNNLFHSRICANPPIIIVGMHRSGTTLLVRLLERAGVFMGHMQTKNKEASFYQRINKDALDMFGCSWRCLDYLPNNETLRTYPWLKAMILKRIEKGFILEYCGTRAIGLLFKRFLWGWKDPRNSLLLPVWHQVYPDATVINIIRDGRDVALSLMVRETRRDRKDSNVTDENAAARFISYVRLWESYVRRINEAMPLFIKTYSLKYEQLLANPSVEFEKLLSELNIPVRMSIAEIVAIIDPNRTKRYETNQYSWTKGIVDDLPLLKELHYT
ncbi:MAG: sulfotransferase [Bacillota bacterium]